MDVQWQKLTPAEKFEERIKMWLAPQGVEFASPEMEQAYQHRVKMIKDVFQQIMCHGPWRRDILQRCRDTGSLE